MYHYLKPKINKMKKYLIEAFDEFVDKKYRKAKYEAYYYSDEDFEDVSEQCYIRELEPVYYGDYRGKEDRSEFTYGDLLQWSKENRIKRERHFYNNKRMLGIGWW